MKVLVTGGAGYVGSVTVERLLAEGHDVTVLDSFLKGRRAAVPPEARLVTGDVSDRTLLERTLRDDGIDSVLHCAGRSLVGESGVDPAGYFAANVVGGLNLLDAMRADWPAAERPVVLRVDGGMTASDYTMQFLADITNAPVDRPVFMETTALGAAYLAGRKAGICPDLDGFAATWRLDHTFEPRMDSETRDRKWSGWQDAVRRTLTRR